MKFTISKEKIQEALKTNYAVYILEGEPVEEVKKCTGAHCRCMNIGGQCSNMHYAECVEHNESLREKQGKAGERCICDKNVFSCKMHKLPSSNLVKKIEELKVTSNEDPENKAASASDTVKLIEKINELIKAHNHGK